MSFGNTKQIKCTREPVRKSVTNIRVGRHLVCVVVEDKPKRRKTIIHLYTILSGVLFSDQFTTWLEVELEAHLKNVGFANGVTIGTDVVPHHTSIGVQVPVESCCKIVQPST